MNLCVFLISECGFGHSQYIPQSLPVSIMVGFRGDSLRGDKAREDLSCSCMGLGMLYAFTLGALRVSENGK